MAIELLQLSQLTEHSLKVGMTACMKSLPPMAPVIDPDDVDATRCEAGARDQHEDA